VLLPLNSTVVISTQPEATFSGEIEVER
jgi:hypothetical protein